MAENKLLLKGFAWLVCCAISCSAWAGRPVRVYEVDLKGGQSPASLQDAMREALVRTTGRRESATDPALANLISEAQKYVKSYSPVTRGQSQVIFGQKFIFRLVEDSLEEELLIFTAKSLDSTKSTFSAVTESFEVDEILPWSESPK